MSDSTKRIEASTLRSGSVKEQFNLDHAHANCGTGHDTVLRRTGRKAEAFHRWTLFIAGEIARLPRRSTRTAPVSGQGQSAKAGRDDLKRFYILRASQEVCP